MNDRQHTALVSQLVRASAESGQSLGRILALALVPLLIALAGLLVG